MKKSITSRIRITRTGKIVRRPGGVNHFRTRKNPNTIRGKRKGRSLDYPLKNIVRAGAIGH